jgi:hypothetical protein
MNGTLLVKLPENSNKSIILDCSARGRPAAAILIYDARGDVVSRRNVTDDDMADLMAVVETFSEFAVVVNKCNQTGNFKCKADNGVGDFEASSGLTVFLGVLCEGNLLFISFV